MLGVASVFSISVSHGLETQYSSFLSSCATIELFSVTSRVVIPSRVRTSLSFSPGRNDFTSQNQNLLSDLVSLSCELRRATRTNWPNGAGKTRPDAVPIVNADKSNVREADLASMNAVQGGRTRSDGLLCS